jgi:hypothetical protein
VKHELFEELEAWNPKWQQIARNIRDAAERAGALALYDSWLQTSEGKAYLQTLAGVPDYTGAIKAAQESADRLPFNLGNIGAARDSNTD